MFKKKKDYQYYELKVNRRNEQWTQMIELETFDLEKRLGAAGVIVRRTVKTPKSYKTLNELGAESDLRSYLNYVSDLEIRPEEARLHLVIISFNVQEALCKAVLFASTKQKTQATLLELTPALLTVLCGETKIYTNIDGYELIKDSYSGPSQYFLGSKPSGEIIYSDLKLASVTETSEENFNTSLIFNDEETSKVLYRLQELKGMTECKTTTSYGKKRYTTVLTSDWDTDMSEKKRMLFMPRIIIDTKKVGLPYVNVTQFTHADGLSTVFVRHFEDSLYKLKDEYNGSLYESFKRHMLIAFAWDTKEAMKLLPMTVKCFTDLLDETRGTFLTQLYRRGDTLGRATRFSEFLNGRYIDSKIQNNYPRWQGYIPIIKYEDLRDNSEKFLDAFRHMNLLNQEQYIIRECGYDLYKTKGQAHSISFIMDVALTNEDINDLPNDLLDTIRIIRLGIHLDFADKEKKEYEFKRLLIHMHPFTYSYVLDKEEKRHNRSWSSMGREGTFNEWLRRCAVTLTRD